MTEGLSEGNGKDTWEEAALASVEITHGAVRGIRENQAAALPPSGGPVAQFVTRTGRPATAAALYADEEEVLDAVTAPQRTHADTLRKTRLDGVASRFLGADLRDAQPPYVFPRNIDRRVEEDEDNPLFRSSLLGPLRTTMHQSHPLPRMTVGTPASASRPSTSVSSRNHALEDNSFQQLQRNAAMVFAVLANREASPSMRTSRLLRSRTRVTMFRSGRHRASLRGCHPYIAGRRRKCGNGKLAAHLTAARYAGMPRCYRRPARAIVIVPGGSDRPKW